MSCDCCKCCSKLFNDPRLLPCLHVFCKSCLESDQSRNGGTLSCSICYKISTRQNPAHLPRHLRVYKKSSTAAIMTDIQSGLPCGSCTSNKNAIAYCQDCECGICFECVSAHKKFHIFKGHDILSNIDKQSNEVTSKPVKCDNHGEEILQYYCITCSSLVCSECILFSDHKEHVYSHLHEAMELEKPDLQSILPLLEEAIPSLLKSMDNIDIVTKKVSVRKDELKNDIDQVFQEILSAIEKRRKDLIWEVDAMAVAKTTQLQIQREGLEKLTAGIQLTLQAGTQACNDYSSAEFLSVKSFIKDNAATLIQELSSTQLQPVSDDCMNLIVDQQLVAKICEIGLIQDYSCHPPLCSLVGISPKLPIGISKGCDTSLVLQIRDCKGDDVKFSDARVEAIIHDQTGKTVGEGVVRDLENGQYEIIIENVSKAREYLLHVNVEGDSISGSPYAINVRDYAKIKKPFCTIHTPINPACLYVDEEFLYATFNDGSIFTYDKKGKKMRELPAFQIGLKELRGVVVDRLNDVIFLAADNKIIKATLDGKVITSVGIHGSGELEFNAPLQICQGKNGYILVADQSNCRIQILGSDLSFVKAIACQSVVHGVAVDSDGNVHVPLGWQVEVFSFAGDNIAQYGKSVLENSGNIAFINNKYSVVSEEDVSGKVFIFDWVNDTVINTIGNNLLNPFGVSVDQAGTIYVTEYEGARILMY